MRMYEEDKDVMTYSFEWIKTQYRSVKYKTLEDQENAGKFPVIYYVLKNTLEKAIITSGPLDAEGLQTNLDILFQILEEKRKHPTLIYYEAKGTNNE